MISLRLIKFTMFFWTLAVGKGHVYADPDSSESLVRGTLARSEAVFSARMKYHYKCQFARRESPVNERETRASFDGSNWVSRTHTKEDVGERANYNGKLIIHLGHNPGAKSTQPDWVAVKRPQAIDENDPPEVPYFAGSFWHKATEKYVEDHALEAKVKGHAHLKGIDVLIVEWIIPHDWKVAAAAFHGANDLTEEGGVLRVYAAPQLGHVLPRIEMVGKGGALGHLFEAEDFHEATPGVFIPRHFSQHLYDSKGLVYWEEYTINHLEKVNEPIPPEDFIIEAPHGSVLVDERSLKESRSYRVGASFPKDLNDILSGMPPSPPSRLRTRFTALQLGLAVGAIVLAGIYFFRRWSKRGQRA